MKISIDDIKKSACGHLNDHLISMKSGELKKSKYNNKKIVIDGRVFDSKKEGARFIELRTMQWAGVITDLECQVEFKLEVEGGMVASYLADFTYNRSGQKIVEDVKSKVTKTAVYRLKKKLMKQIYGIEILET